MQKYCRTCGSYCYLNKNDKRCYNHKFLLITRNSDKKMDKYGFYWNLTTIDKCVHWHIPSFIDKMRKAAIKGGK